MKNILVPTDFSEYANNAFDFACSIAHHSKGEITLLHVLEHPTPSGSIYPDALLSGEIFVEEIKNEMRELRQQVNSEMDKFSVHPRYGNVKIKKEIKIGNPFENIARVIEQMDSDLVVMGTRGASGLKELFIGSNAEKVVRFSHCPVITVPGKFEFQNISKIAYGITFYDDHNDTLLELKKYLHLFDARLDLVWVNSLYDTIDESEARRKMKEIAEKQMIKNYSVNCFRGLSADDGLLYFAEENGIDMIAMATHNRKGLAHVFTGSFAEDVVNHSSRPVWTFSLKKKKTKKKHETQEAREYNQ